MTPLANIHEPGTLRTLIDLLPVGIVIAHDSLCERVTVNAVAAEMLGIQAHQNAGLVNSDSMTPFRVLKDGKELPPDEMPLPSALKSGHEVRDVELQVVHAGGRVLYLLACAAPMRDTDGHPAGGVQVLVDVTARVRHEMQLKETSAGLEKLNTMLERRIEQCTAEAAARTEQLQSLALALADAEGRERKRLGQLVHDHLQQIVSAAKLKAGIIRRVAPDPAVKTHAGQLEGLLEEAINASRSLTAELAPPVLYDAGLAAAVESLARSLIQCHNIQIKVQWTPELEPETEQVRVLLFESVRELLHNVITHARARNVIIRCSVLADGGAMELIVQDDGDGFEIATLFTNAPAAPARHFGLLEIRERLRYIGGTVDIASRPGQGTLVRLVVPVTLRHVMPQPAIAPIEKQESVIVRDRRPGQRARLLVADDHAMFREGLIGLLKQESFLEVVGEAGDGEEAVSLAHQLQPDIMILDVSMPKMNGIEVAKRLSCEMPSLRIVALSMHERQDMSAAMKAAGATAFLTKGGSSEALITLLRSLATG